MNDSVNIREKIINNAVLNLREFGYKFANSKNIFTDYMLRAFFESMLKDNLGKGADETINELLAEVKESHND